MSSGAGLLDTSERKPVHLRAGKGGTYLRLTPSAHQLLEQVDQGASFEEIAERINASGGTPVTAARVEAAYLKLRARIEELEAGAAKLEGAFWLKLPLVPEKAVARIASVGTALFHPAFALAAVLGILVVGVALVRTDGFSLRLVYSWQSMALFLVSLVAHEFGHASACARYGAKPGDIGLTAYFIYPAFYCDVSTAWTLKRGQRVVVDLGGVYFQLLVGIAYAVAWRLSGWEALRGSLLLIAVSCLMSLNPLFKFDGYWVLADALGVTNLSGQLRRLGRVMVRRARRLPVTPLPWPGAIIAAVVAYSVISFGFWVVVLRAVLPAIWAHGRHYAESLTLLGHALLVAPHRPSWALVREVLLTTYLLLFAVQMMRRLLRLVPGPWAQWNKALRDRLRELGQRVRGRFFVSVRRPPS